MSLIDIVDLTFGYEDSFVNVFENVCLQLDTNWKLGMIAKNGKGKTTFCKLLMNELSYRGKINAKVKFEYFPYIVNDSQKNSQEIILEYLGDIPQWMIEKELNKLQLKSGVLSQSFETLSHGEKTKILLLILFLKDNNFLLIDEPTNHLDLPGRELVSRYLNTKKGFLLVSHDRAFLDGCVDHILSINKANIEVCRGNFSTWYENKQRQDSFELSENEKLKREIRRLEGTAREKASWSDRAEATKIGNHVFDRGYVGHKAEKMMARSKAIEKRQNAAIEEKSKLLKNIERSDTLKIFQTPFHTKRLASLVDVSVCYGETPVCRGVTFDIQQGDRIVLQGANGSGKSSIIKLICGEQILHTGELRIGTGLTISYVPQDASHLRGRLSDFARESGVDESLFLAMLAKLDVSKEQMEKDMSALSAGQKKKVLLARSICQSKNLHIWDEPMNYIDVISRMQIEELLLTFQPTILFVEHDKTFCDRIATKVVPL